MATFTSLAAADLRAIAKGPAPGGDNTWVYAHSAYATQTATPCVRVVRRMTSTLTQGAWVELTDDAAV